MESVQINTSMDRETAKMLDEMAADKGYDNRSAFIRWLIRREYAALRAGQARQTHPTSEPQAESR